MDTRTAADSRRARRGAVALLTFGLLAAVGPVGASAQTTGGGSEPTGGTPPAAVPPQPSGSPDPAFRGNGMWIWQLPRAYGGSVSRIVAKARRHGVTTLFLKSGDGLHRWGQFSPAVVQAFKSAGLHVCGWQYVYGNSPIGEANVSAWAKQAGADCFVIDAEAEYQGKYIAADLYVRRLRSLVGASYPVALAPFPYVDYHPGFPYSVFLAPGAAQANQPQMYWHTIGTSVDQNFSHTYTWNRIYKRPIFPLGQTYDRAPTAQIRRFRQVARAYGAQGVSWWEWTQTSETRWRAVGDPVGALTQYRAATGYPRLRLKSRGDFVVWAQQHLYAAGPVVPLDGIFGPATRNAVSLFQQSAGLPATGVLDNATWAELLKVKPVAVRWRKFQKGSKAYPARAARAAAAVIAPAPRSATLPAKGYEIPPKR
jgi:putative peptidoglycan binding protein